MIQIFVDRFMESKPKLEAAFLAARPESYKDLVKAVVGALATDDELYSWENPDPDRIHQIDDGDYQGTLVFVIAAQGYQPSTYWYVKVDYGSCSGCDTLASVRECSDYDSETPNQNEIDGYMTLALHIVQGLKKMGDEE